MSMAERFIRKPVMTTLATITLVSFGLVAYFKLPVSDLPSVEFPVITISVGYPGASPLTMANTVASPIEQQCMMIPGLQAVFSDNTSGETQILLNFDLNRSVDLIAPDVQAALTRAQADLPSDLPAPPVYQKTNPSDLPINYITLVSDVMTPGQLYDYANKMVAQQISTIEGVSQVAVWGAKTAVRVQVDPDKLAAYKIGLNEIAEVLNTGTVLEPGGSLNGPFRAFSIEPQGQLFKAADYAKLIVAYRNGAPIRLGDVSHCIDSVNSDVLNVKLGMRGDEHDGNLMLVAVWRRSGANTIAVSKSIQELLNQIKTTMPATISLNVFYDRAESIKNSIHDVEFTVVLALILVVLVIFLFLGRVVETIIPSISLPVSIIGTFAIMAALGFSLDNLSLMALVLCVGFLVDDAIVVLENTVRHVDEGKKPIEAALVSMKEITMTVVSTSVALIIVFVPLVYMGGVVGRNFRELALTVIAAIFCSMMVALTLTPMMCARLLKHFPKKNLFQRVIGTIVSGMVRGYGVGLHWVLRHKYVSALAWLLCICGTGWMFYVLPQTFMPNGDSGLVYGLIQMARGTSTDQARLFQNKLANLFSANTNVDKFVTITGLNVGADQSTGKFFIRLKPREERAPIEDVVASLQEKGLGYTEGMAFFAPMPALRLSSGGESTAVGSKYSYVMNGSDRLAVYKAAEELKQRMERTPGLVSVQSSVTVDMPQLNVKFLRDRASTFGITADGIEKALMFAFAQGKITLFKTDIDQYWVMMEVLKKYREHPADLDALYLRSPAGDMVPLASLVDIEETLGPQDVPHFNQFSSATLSFSLVPSMPLGTALEIINKNAAEVMPPGVMGHVQGEAKEFVESMTHLGVLMLVAIFLMYVILGILYESYIHPFTVLTTLPVAAFGGLVTIWLFGQVVTLYAYIGMFMLLGIVAKNGIMMVDFAIQRLDEGMTSFDAIYDACLIRFRPILMTGMAAIMGAVPLAVGYGADGESRIPLGLIVVGGLIFSQVVTLFVTPGVFLIMEGFRKKAVSKDNLLPAEAMVAEAGGTAE